MIDERDRHQTDWLRLNKLKRELYLKSLSYKDEEIGEALARAILDIQVAMDKLKTLIESR